MAHTRIIFLIFPKMHLLDLAGPLQVFQEAQEYGADISIEYCSNADELMTASALPLGQLLHFRDIELKKGDYLFIPGAEVSYLRSSAITKDRELLQWVRQANADGVFVCSICTGAFFLGEAGLLNGRTCTTHWKRTAELKKRYASVRLEEDILFTEDDSIFTSAGVMAGTDLALHILARITSDHLAFKVARELVIYMRRQGGDSQQSVFVQYRNHIHSGVHKVQDYLQENLQRKNSLPQLAGIACMSTRNLTRTFRKETGISVNEYTVLLRKELLRQLSSNRDLSRKQMARQCGLKSERQVIRLLKSIPT